MNRPVGLSSEQFIKLPRDLLRSDAWRSLGINARRVLDFLMTEHLANGGAKNGELMAPREQLEEYGIGARYISAAIDSIVATGLVECRRGIGKRANLYRLTWLPSSDGTGADHLWKRYLETTLRPVPTRGFKLTGSKKAEPAQTASQGKSLLASQRKSKAA